MKWLIHIAYECDGCVYGSYLRDFIIPKSINNTYNLKPKKISFLFQTDEKRKMFLNKVNDKLIKHNKIYKTYNSTYTYKKKDFDLSGLISKKEYYLLLKNNILDDIIEKIDSLNISKGIDKKIGSTISKENNSKEIGSTISKDDIDDITNKMDKLSIETNILAYIKIQTKYKESHLPFYNKDLKFDVDQLTCIYNGSKFIFSDHILATKTIKKEAIMTKNYLSNWYWANVLSNTLPTTLNHYYLYAQNTNQNLLKKIKKFLFKNWDIILPNNKIINKLSFSKISLERTLKLVNNTC